MIFVVELCSGFSTELQALGSALILLDSSPWKLSQRRLFVHVCSIIQMSNMVNIDHHRDIMQAVAGKYG